MALQIQSNKDAQKPPERPSEPLSGDYRYLEWKQQQGKKE